MQELGPQALDGGEEPIWSRDGRSLVYRWGQAFYALSVPSRGSATFGRPREILRGPYLNVWWRSHDLGPDGRHLLIRGPEEEVASRLNVITNFFEELRRKVGP